MDVMSSGRDESTSDLLYMVRPPGHPFWKLGYVTTTKESLFTRYRWSYGEIVEMKVFECQSGLGRALEQAVFEELAEHRINPLNELFTAHEGAGEQYEAVLRRIASLEEAPILYMVKGKLMQMWRFGCTRMCPSMLRQYYVTPYGSDMDLRTYECTDDRMLDRLQAVMSECNARKVEGHKYFFHDEEGDADRYAEAMSRGSVAAMEVSHAMPVRPPCDLTSQLRIVMFGELDAPNEDMDGAELRLADLRSDEPDSHVGDAVPSPEGHGTGVTGRRTRRVCGLPE
jgi:hypothetical protein